MNTRSARKRTDPGIHQNQMECPKGAMLDTRSAMKSMDPGVASPALFERLWAPVEFAQKCNFSSSGVRKRGWMARTEGFNFARNIPAASQELPRASQSIPKASPERPQSVPERPRSVPGERRLEVTKSHLARAWQAHLFFALFVRMQSWQKVTRPKGGLGPILRRLWRTFWPPKRRAQARAQS